MLQAQMVWRAKPEAVYLRRGNHLLDRIECPGVTHTKPLGEIGCGFSALAGWAVHTEHISIAHAYPRLNVTARYKSAADASHPKHLPWHYSTRPIYTFAYPPSVTVGH